MARIHTLGAMFRSTSIWTQSHAYRRHARLASVVLCIRCAFLICLSPLYATAAVNADAVRFDFGSAPAKPGFTHVAGTSLYSAETGCGFEPGAAVETTGHGCSSDKPFYFSVALPEGNYEVTVTLGDEKAESVTTVKAEARRLMLEKVRTAPGKFEERTFTVNVRTPRISGDGEVRLNRRELGPPLVPDWDEKLTLEFNGAHPSLADLRIARTNDPVTLYIAGDSTVTDQANEPWASWGQMLPRFFKPGVAVANHAESGLALRSFMAQKRLDKVLSTMKAGDYLFIQFGHNDQKEKGEGVGAFTT